MESLENHFPISSGELDGQSLGETSTVTDAGDQERAAQDTDETDASQKE
jgi:hypothetical protein